MTSRSAVATLAFFAFTSGLGIVAHLVSEFAGLGWHDDSDLILSARHGYLACIAIVIFAVLIATLSAAPKADRRARISSLIEALPFGGRGFAFFAVTFVAQFGFFALTQIGEGCPLCSGDVFTGVFAAVVAAVIGALLITLGKRRVLEIAFALCELLAVVSQACAGVRYAERERRVDAKRNRRRSSFSFRYRPPPLKVASV